MLYVYSSAQCLAHSCYQKVTSSISMPSVLIAHTTLRCCCHACGSPEALVSSFLFTLLSLSRERRIAHYECSVNFCCQG